MAKLISEDLIKNGKVERGWLGASIQPLTPELAKTFKAAFKKGVLVNEVMPKAPAHKGGLKQGDIIVVFDGNDVTSPKVLQKMVAFAKIGKTVEVKVLRNGEMKTIKIIVEKVKS
jgi:S1-C subfamily serine protease